MNIVRDATVQAELSVHAVLWVSPYRFRRKAPVGTSLKRARTKMATLNVSNQEATITAKHSVWHYLYVPVLA